ncbi:CU044_5270 family protein [Actinomadura napierensis]|uniref:CU044_5270 family protein n=1 Tax=Actinomadura napierensis TaxID=267854 RepID=A0ABN2YNT5_9ACTN
MDELQMIATMLDEPPTPETEAAVRHRLLNGMRAPQRPARRAWRRPALWSGFGLAATATVVAGAVTLSSGTTPRAPDPVDARPVSARTVLLAAAKQADAAPAAGEYWHVRALQAFPTQVGPKSNRYWMDKLVVNETWTNAAGVAWSGHREVGARPHSVADELAWRRDGSPTRWDLGTADTPGGGGLVLSTSPRPGDVVKMKGPHTVSVCDKEMSFEQAQALPAQSDALKNALRNAMLDNDDGPVPGSARNGFLQQCLAGLLAEVPTRPKVRGAAYRALASLPGVTSAGRAADEGGRKGVGLVLQSTRGPLYRLVIDPKTSLVLSESVEQTGAAAKVKSKFQRTRYLAVGWTDSGPKAPALP